MRATLPPMSALKAFEPVGRCGSLNAAAAELRMVRGAIRQQLAVMDTGFALQALSLERVARGGLGEEACVVPVPADIDASVASAYLALNR